ncbi:ubiquitin family protein [Methanoplanus limicola]|uniref:Thiamine S protein n=1 Tax=Methanoplanus limicola DSM 2279 TaxID=937775 RepID=H1Z2S6_9EURY|nr:MoaD/ThiS family protein [Methanoplanus limicola]EHQ36479.1 thiamine S protein [Methanoplanus limicola DSM 2279]
MWIILPDKSIKNISSSAPIEEILLELGLNPASFIVVKNGSVVPEDVSAGEDDEIKLITISHGG